MLNESVDDKEIEEREIKSCHNSKLNLYERVLLDRQLDRTPIQGSKIDWLFDWMNMKKQQQPFRHPKWLVRITYIVILWYDKLQLNSTAI